MHKLSQTWALAMGVFFQFLGAISNDILSKLVNLLTIAVLMIGLLDYLIRRLIKSKREKKQSVESLMDDELELDIEDEPPALSEPSETNPTNDNVIHAITKTQKSFRTLELLENPTSAGEHLGAALCTVASEVKGMKFKNFFKWLWYNKEQMGSILFNALVLIASQYLIWTKQITDIFHVEGRALLVLEIVIGVVAVLGTALTIRNTCVKYGLSSLATIDNVLAERAEEAAKQLTPEQRKTIKANIGVLSEKLNTFKNELAEKTAAYEKIKCLHDADASLVEGYEAETAQYNKLKLSLEKVIATLETKIKEYNDALK